MAITENPRLEHLTQAQLFQKINDICAVVNVAADSRELLRISLKGTLDLFGAERGSIFILRPDSQALVLKIAEGMALNEEEKLVKRIGEGVVGRVAAIKMPIVVEDISRDERFKNYKARRSYRTPSFICAPLLVKDSLLGVINISDKESGHHFSKDEMQLLDFLSTQIALNYRRIELYQKFKRILRESQTLKDELGKSSQETSHLKQKMVVQEKLASIGKLAGGIAHEFNNPLDGVIRYTNLCLEHTKCNESCELCRGYLLEIKDGLTRMANIVKNLLACSRSAVPTMRRIDPAFAMAQAVRSVQTDAVSKNVIIESHASDNLPEITDMGFDRVIINLLLNAIDAVGEQGKISISGTHTPGRLVIKVQDNGCGIAAEAQEMIFEPFYTTKDIAKGCGLGLTIVNEIIKSYEGQIRVESALGKGTTFVLTIPVHKK